MNRLPKLLSLSSFVFLTAIVVLIFLFSILKELRSYEHLVVSILLWAVINIAAILCGQLWDYFEGKVIKFICYAILTIGFSYLAYSSIPYTPRLDFFGGIDWLYREKFFFLVICCTASTTTGILYRNEIRNVLFALRR